MQTKKKLLLGAVAAAVATAVPVAIAATAGPAAAAADPLPVTITNNTGRSGPVYLYVLSEDLASKRMGYVNAAGTWQPWTGGGAVPEPAPDVSIPGPSNGSSVTLKIPRGVNGRIYFSFGEKLKLAVVSGGKLVQPAPWVSADPNFKILFDWSEFTYDKAGLFLNSTQVDMLSIPHAVSSTGSSGKQTTGQLVDDGRNRIINAVRAQAGFEKSVVTADDGSVLRVLAPGKAMTSGLMNDKYLDPYIDQAWNAYTNRTLTIEPFEDNRAVKFFGRSSGNVMNFTDTSGAFVGAVNKPSTADVWNCNGNLEAPNDNRGLITRTLCAALNRGTLGASDLEPVYDANKFYKNNPTNHFSRIVHENMVDKKAYGFPFDDVGHFESLVKDHDPVAASITLTPFGPGGAPNPGQPNPGQPNPGQPNPGQPNPGPTNPGPTGGTWAPNVTYSVGQIVTHNGRRYQCRQSHTALPGWEPPVVLALWKPVP